MKPEAKYWESVDGRVRCRLCPNVCIIAPGKAGRCLGRRNVAGRLEATSYGEVVSLAVDPIEKKPLYHFLPGSEILSVATYGCNLQCPFCQNAEISQQVAPSRYVSPEQLLEQAKRCGTPAIAYTYNEPCVWFEYLLDAGGLMKKEGIRNVLVTNGMLSPEPLAELLPLVDAMNIDLKSIRPEFYREYVKGNLDTVLETIRQAREACHVELTNLLIPDRNDSESDIADLVDFVAGLGRETPLHFSRYYPGHRETKSQTPTETLRRAAETARQRLHYVYLGNITASKQDRDTFCPQCGNLLVDRENYSGRITGIVGGSCSKCGQHADFVMEPEPCASVG